MKIVYSIILTILTTSSVIALDVKNGDIIFQNIPSSQSKAIELATHSQFTHVGIIFYKDSIPYVLEAVQPVRYTELSKWIDFGKKDYFVIKRLIKRDSLISDSIIKNMIKEGEPILNHDYDIYFNWSDDELYCSELVWKIYKRGANIELCKLNKLKEYDLSHQEVKNIMKKRYGNSPPLDEFMVSPQDIFDSKLLMIVE